MVVILSQSLYYFPEQHHLEFNPFIMFLTNKHCKNINNMFPSLLKTIVRYDPKGLGIPIISEIDEKGQAEFLVTNSCYLFSIFADYKPPTVE